jgi:hypothetical protein
VWNPNAIVKWKGLLPTHHSAPLPSKPMGGNFFTHHHPICSPNEHEWSLQPPPPSPTSPNEWECLHCPTSQLTVRVFVIPTLLLFKGPPSPLPSLEQGWAFITQLHVCMYYYISSLNEQEPSFHSFLLLAISIINLNIITMSVSFSYLSNAFGSGSKRKVNIRLPQL